LTTKSKFKVTRGLAHIVTTGEPVFVTDFVNEQDEFGRTTTYAKVIRAVVTGTDGIQHREERFPLEQLETRFEQAKRGVEFEAYIQELREEQEKKRYAMPTGMKQALEDLASQRQATIPSSPKQLSLEGLE
jgi:hypothetical protein